MARSSVLVAGTVVLVGMLAGCSQQRPLHIVKSNAQFNAEHNHFDVAKKDYQEYIKRKPEDVEVRYLYAKALIDNHQPKEAIEQLNLCLEIFPLNDDYTDSLAQAMHDAGDRDGLTSLLARYASERGRVVDYTRWGMYSAKIGNVDEAKQALLTAAKLDQGRNVGPQRNLADFYGSLGDKGKQVRHLRMAYYIQPANPGTLKEVRRIGEIPGPTFALAPDDLNATAAPVAPVRDANVPEQTR